MATGVIESSAAAPLPDQQLQGKSNYTVWHLKFKREARDMDVLDILTAKEDVVTEPTEEDCIVYTDGSTALDSAATRSKEVDSTRSLLKWQTAHRRWESSKQKVRQARRLLEKWVSPAILLEIEDKESPADAYTHVTQTYSVTNEFAQEQILRDIQQMRLGKFSSMTAFLNEHRVLKARLASVGYTAYSDGQMVTNILLGLPAAYRDFKEQYDWIRAKDGDAKHDLDFLFNRLLLKEVSVNKEKALEDQKRAREQAAAAAAAKRQQNSNRPNANNDKDKSDKSDKSDKPDRSHLQCQTCGRNGHDERSCWVTHPDRIPKGLRGIWTPPPAKEKEDSTTTTVVQKEQTSSSSSSSKGVRPEGLIALCSSTSEFTQTLRQLRASSSIMTRLVLSTEGVCLDSCLPGMDHDEQEIMKILCRVHDPRVDDAAKPVVILTGSYNINDWALPRNLLLHFATVHIRTLVNNGTISLQSTSAETPMTEIVAGVQDPDLLLTQLMSAEAPDDDVDGRIAILNNQLGHGQLCVDPPTQNRPDKLLFSTYDVTPGAEFTTVFSAEICEIIKIWKLVVVGRSVEDGSDIVIFTTADAEHEWPHTNHKVVEAIKNFIRTYPRLTLEHRESDQDFATDCGLVHRLVCQSGGVTVREENVGLVRSLLSFFQRATESIGDLGSGVAQNPSSQLSPTEVSTIVNPLGEGDVVRLGDDYAVVHGARGERKVELGELVYSLQVRPLNVADAFVQAEIDPTIHMPGAWPRSPNAGNDAQSPGTPIPILSSPVALADLSRQSSFATEVILESEGWDRVLGLVAVVGKEAMARHKNTVLLDSGADICIFNDKKWFRNLTALNVSVGSIGQDARLSITGGGDVSLVLVNESGATKSLTITDAALAPHAKYNIVSLSQLGIKGGFTGHWNKDMITINHNGQQIGLAEQSNGLFQLKLREPSTDVSSSDRFVGLVEYDSPVWQCHRAMGHLSLPNMIILLDVSEGLPVTKAQIQKVIASGEVCPVCAIAKALDKTPREPARRRETEMGALIHADTWGPYPIESYDGLRYFMFFTDDATRFTWEEGFRTKDQIPAVFRKMHRGAETQFKITIRGYRFDGEFYQGAIGRYLERHHVRSEVTVAYSHYMGGSHERVNRTLRDKAAPMIQEHAITSQLTKVITEPALHTIKNSKLPENLWSEAIRYSVWTKNRSPTRALRNRVPIQPEVFSSTQHLVHVSPASDLVETRSPGSSSQETSSIDVSEQRVKTHKNMTPWQAAYGIKPKLNHEQVWGTRVWVTIPLEVRSVGKLHAPRAWLGQFVGLDSEAVYRVWNEDKHQVFRVGEARVQRGHGEEDSHDGETFAQREERERQQDPAPVEVDDDDGPRSEVDAAHSVADEAAVDDDDVHYLFEDEDGNLLDSDPPQSEEQVADPQPSLANQPDGGGGNVEDAASGSLDSDGGDRRMNLTSHFFAATICMVATEDSSSDGSYISSDDAADDGVSPAADDTDTPDPVDRAPVSKRILEDDATVHEGEACSPCVQQGARCLFVKFVDEDGDVRTTMCTKCVGIGRRTCLKISGARYTQARNKAQERRQRRRRIRENTKGIQLNGVPKDQKCYRCRKRERACDGRVPCDTCLATGSKRIIHACGSEQGPEAEKCDNCTRAGTTCKGRPCASCVKQNQNCAFTAKDGLFKTIYPVTPREKATYDRLIDGVCTRCTTSRASEDVCRTHSPCFVCVRHSTDDQILPCTKADKESGTLLRYQNKAWEMCSVEGRPKLRENWMDFAYRQAKVPEKAVNPQKASARNKPKPETEGELQARIAFGTDLSRPLRMATSGVGRLCAWNALRKSWTALRQQIGQGLGITTADITNEQLDAAYDRIARENPEFQMGNRNMFRVDQMAAAVSEVIRTEFSINIQLGYVHPYNHQRFFAVLVPVPDDFRVDYRLWVYNNNAGAEEWDQAHFEGLINETDCVSNHGEVHMVQAGGLDGLPDQNILIHDGSSDEDYDSLPEELPIDADIMSYLSIHDVMAVTQQGILADPQSYAEAMRSFDAQGWIAGMNEERDSIVEAETFEEVPIDSMPPGVVPITSKWVWARRYTIGGQVARHKVRLCARGFQQRPGIDYHETYAAVIKAVSWRIIIAIAAILGWHLHAMDVKTAFLNGDLKEVIFMRPPPGWKVPKGMIWRLRKTLYGLKQAPREWYIKISTKLMEWGFRKSPFDECVFIDPAGEVIVGVWVDDLLITARTVELMSPLKTKLNQTFKMKDDADATLYLGIQIQQGSDGIALCQAHYVRHMLERFGQQKLPGKATPLPAKVELRKNQSEVDPDFLQGYQERNGCLNFLMSQTRPDVAFASQLCSRYNSAPSRDHDETLDHIYGYLAKFPDVAIKYRRGFTDLVSFTDSDFAGCLDTRRSTTGWVIVFGGAPISWCSRRQKTVTLSTTHAEYVAAAELARETIWVKGFMDFLGLPIFSANSIPMYIDNDAATSLTQSPHTNNKTKYVDIRHHFVRERVVEIGDITTHRVDTRFNIADLLTKTLPRDRHYELMKLMGLVSAQLGGRLQGGFGGAAEEDMRGEGEGETHDGPQS